MNFKKILLIIVAPFVLFACGNKEKAEGIVTDKIVQLDSMQASCPYLTKDTKGNAVLSWARIINDTSSVFCYAVSTDNGRTFGKIILVPGSNNIQPHSENLPKIIFKPSGEIIAMWGAANPSPANKYSGLVYYSQSFDDGNNWTAARPLVSDTAGYDQRYYDVALLPSGEAAVIWLDNRKAGTEDGSALYFASTDGKNGFTNEKIIGEGCCQCCRTDLYVDSRSGIHVLYRGIIKDSIRDMLHSVSMDGGRNFSKPQLISDDNWVIRGCPHTGPAMTENKTGIHFAWFTGGREKGCFYTRSTNNGESFYQRDRISNQGSHPQLTALPDGKIVIAWDEPMLVHNKYCRRIAVEKRTAAGTVENRGFVTADTADASYPVVIPLSDKDAGIAYTIKNEKKTFIRYQRIGL